MAELLRGYTVPYFKHYLAHKLVLELEHTMVEYSTKNLISFLLIRIRVIVQFNTMVIIEVESNHSINNCFTKEIAWAQP